jgi:hypothetical protein
MRKLFLFWVISISTLVCIGQKYNTPCVLSIDTNAIRITSNTDVSLDSLINHKSENGAWSIDSIPESDGATSLIGISPTEPPQHYFVVTEGDKLGSYKLKYSTPSGCVDSLYISVK